MRRRLSAVCAAVVLAALAAAGCGDDRGNAPEGPTARERKSRFIRQADAICTKFQQRTENQRGARTAEGTARQVREARETAAAALDELRALNPPPADQQVLDRYFTLVEGSVRDFLPRLERAARRGNREEAQQLFAEVRRRGAEARRLAQQYGFKVCGGSASGDG